MPGPRGIDGFPGNSGVPGAKGSKGNKGQSGTVGPQGPRGRDGIVIIPPDSMTQAERGEPGDIGKRKPCPKGTNMFNSSTECIK